MRGDSVKGMEWNGKLQVDSFLPRVSIITLRCLGLRAP